MANEKQNLYEINNIIRDLKDENFQNALKKTKTLSINRTNKYTIYKLYSSIYYKLRDYENAINYYEKLLNYEKESFKIYNNIGTSLFQLGKINKSISAYIKSIDNKINIDAYLNLGIAYEEIGDYENAIKSYINVIKLDTTNLKAKTYLINILNFYEFKNYNDNPLLKINFEINQIYKNYQTNNLYNLNTIIKVLKSCNKLLDNYEEKIYINETQIFRKNSKNLNCKRHFKIFNKLNIIPKYCFSCYKIQISLFNVIDLIKLYFFFNEINLKNNNLRKCMIETRENIKVNYKGYIYCEGLEEAKTILKELNYLIKDKNFYKFNIEIKHGCSEYYSSYPGYKKINFKGKQAFEYNPEWRMKEKLIDDKIPIRAKQDQKFFGESLGRLNLYDILVIKNWIIYAKKIGDKYSNKILDDKLSFPNFEKIIEKQIDFRKKELLSD